MNNRELSIQITLGGFSFRAISPDGTTTASGESVGYDFDTDLRLSEDRFNNCFCTWSTTEVMITPRAIFDENLAEQYLIAGGFIPATSRNAYRVMHQIGQTCVAIWAVDTALAMCIENHFQGAIHSHPLLSIIESSPTERECVKIFIDNTFVAHICIWDHRGLVTAQSVKLSSNEDLLYYIRRFSPADPFMVYRIYISGEVSESLEALISSYYISLNVTRIGTLL